MAKNNRFLVSTLTILKSNNQVISPKTEAGVQKRFTIELAYSSIIFPCLFCYYWLGFNLVSKNITAEHSTWILVTNFSETYGLTIIITEIIIYVSGFKTSRRPPEFCRLLDFMLLSTLVITVCLWQTILALLLIFKTA